jgi:WD40 repeat protein
MSGFLGKTFDFGKSVIKAGVGAGLDIGQALFLPKQEIHEENLISSEGATDFAGHSAVINCLAISDDGQTLFSAGKDQNIRMWHTHTGNSAGIVGDQGSEVKWCCRSVCLTFPQSSPS